MELKQTISCGVRLTAGLEEDGTLSVKAFATAEYAPDATTTVEVQADELPLALAAKVKAVLQEALEFASPLLGARIGRAIHKSTEIAAGLGEI